MLFRNREPLLSRGLRAERRLALLVAEAGLLACDPARAVERQVGFDGDALLVGADRHTLSPGGRVLVLGAGKASLKIASALERVLGDRLDGGTVIVPDADDVGPTLTRIEVMEAAHPIPDERSEKAALRLLELASGLGPDDIALACFTGGSSALAALPPAGVSFEDKRELHRLLLGSGMPIGEVNTVRKQVSAFKGGRLAAAVAPARLINLTVSDVAGDVLDALTDPSVPNTSTPDDAIALLRAHALWGDVPQSVRAHLEIAGDGRVDLSEGMIATTLLVTGATACDAMRQAAVATGASPVVVATDLEGEATAVGRKLARLAADVAESGRPAPPCVLVGCGGESTVRLGEGHRFGLGGPNQEAALAAAVEIAGRRVAIVLLDTDGSDGGTAVAGAICAGTSISRAAELGLDVEAAVAEHRSAQAVGALGDAIETGPTLTNVNDLFVIAVGAGAGH